MQNTSSFIQKQHLVIKWSNRRTYSGCQKSSEKHNSSYKRDTTSIILLQVCRVLQITHIVLDITSKQRVTQKDQQTRISIQQLRYQRRQEWNERREVWNFILQLFGDNPLLRFSNPLLYSKPSNLSKGQKTITIPTINAEKSHPTKKFDN